MSRKGVPSKWEAAIDNEMDEQSAQIAAESN
jgi:hypothetical protein